MWTSFGCKGGGTYMPIIYEEGSEDMDCHVFDQWNVSHVLWGFVLGMISMAPKSIAAWKLGLLFVFWELWENVIEVAFSTYAPGQYHGDSLVNSVFDMLPSIMGVYLGRHRPGTWPIFLLVEMGATASGFGIHSVFLGHQGSICDVRIEPFSCGQAYFIRLLLLPLIFRQVEGRIWGALGRSWQQEKTSPSVTKILATSQRDESPAPKPSPATATTTEPKRRKAASASKATTPSRATSPSKGRGTRRARVAT